MKLNRIIACIMICIMMFALCGCEENEPGYSYNICENISLTLVAREQHFSIYVHNETGVMYIAMEASDAKYNGGISVMLDENGKPLIYEKYMGDGK